MRFRNGITVALATFITLLVSPAAKASFLVIVSQVGPDVITTGSGTFDTADLVGGIGGTTGAAFAPSLGLSYMGVLGLEDSFVSVLTGPSSIGIGSGVVAADIATGPVTGVQGSAAKLVLPIGYVSDTLIGNSGTYSNQSFATLGLTPGTYQWTWGSGAHADSYTVEIVPEPGAFWLLFGGIVALGVVKRVRRTEHA
jgi:hypothetical protein